MLIFCLSACRSIHYGHILILLLAFATLISFLQENNFFCTCHHGWVYIYIPESTIIKLLGYLYESANPIVEHVQVSEKNILKELGVKVSPSTVKK